MMNRRRFLVQAGAVVGSARWLRGAGTGMIDLGKAVVIAPEHLGRREAKAVSLLVEEAEKRCGIRWAVEGAGSRSDGPKIYLGTAAAWKAARVTPPGEGVGAIAAEGYRIQSGSGWISITGADARGMMFGAGKLLRSVSFGPEQAAVEGGRIGGQSSPKYRLRGHQLGYRPKTNAYDGWDVARWEQYYRDLIVFGTNAVELIPPRSDDRDNSPHFPLPKDQMMREMSRLADEYGLETWVWYPAMDRDYSDPKTVEAALKEWAKIFELAPRIDAVFVPGGDPGHTEPKYLLALLEKQKANLRRYHPQAQMWMSPQSFTEDWMNEFFEIVERPETGRWLDGIVFGPQSRLPLDVLRKKLPERYPIRLYPDITHSVQCQYPVPDWDIAYALTAGREVINPRPEGEANILRRTLPDSIGFISYSEGCNDDVNKCLWSALAWDPARSVVDVLRDFGRYFVGPQEAEGMAQGLVELEANWRGPLAANTGVAVTFERFQDMERNAGPSVLESWRFQQALYRAYYDAYVQARLWDETGALARALGVLGRVNEIGFSGQPTDIDEPTSGSPPNGVDPSLLLEEADRILAAPMLNPARADLRRRVGELGEALFQSIRMQLAVQRYQGEAVSRAANLETLDHPVSDVAYLRRQIAEIRRLDSAGAQAAAIRKLMKRTDPGPGGFYDELGNPMNRPHLVLGPGSVADPDFRSSPLIGCNYPDHLGDQAPMAWKHWAESLYDTPLRMRYTGLDPEARYRVRVVYSGDQAQRKIRLVANESIEIHPYLPRPRPPAPQEFDVPQEATRGGELSFAWTGEAGLGANGRGCQVSEVWLIRV